MSTFFFTEGVLILTGECGFRSWIGARVPLDAAVSPSLSSQQQQPKNAREWARGADSEMAAEWGGVTRAENQHHISEVLCASTYLGSLLCCRHKKPA